MTGTKNGIVSSHLVQHMAHEINHNGKPYCQRLGVAAHYRILGVTSDQVVDWILTAKLSFDSLNV
ncbi:MAG: hypothetical protein HC924_16865 [Synechococcaceae cyanobacterium SM2_3_2]|nr:hypothetical protein [Synechococcaceae cyanobacterium SM2_3_2]